MMAWTDKRLQHYEQIARDAEAATSIAQANYAEKVLALKTDTIRVVKWATRYDTIRAELDSIAPITDTGITDTVTTVPAYWVRGLIVASDSTIHACRELVMSSGRALTACDSVQIALGREKDAWKMAYERSAKGPRVSGYAEAQRDMIAGDWMVAGGADMRVRGDWGMTARAQRRLVPGDSARLYVGVKRWF
jgi:hypothetical protein